MSHLDTSDVEKRLREKSDAIALKHNSEYTFNSLLVLQLFPLWIGLRVGSQKPHKLTGRVGSGNLDPRATLGETNYLVCRSVNFYHCYIKLTCHTVMLTRTSVTSIVKDKDKVVVVVV